MKPALLIVDMQKKFRLQSPACAESMSSATAYLAYCKKLFERQHLPVFHVVHNEEGPEEQLLDDFWELDELAPADRSEVMVKRHGSAFMNPQLDSRLKEAGVDCLVLGGFAAEFCIMATARHGKDLGWPIMLLRGALASPTPANIPFVEATNQLISVGALETLLKGLG
jgi:isochorismate hydrolase